MPPNTGSPAMSKSAPQFLFDVGSPNAYLSHEAIPAIDNASA